MQLRGITICLDYADLLRVTLARNMRHLSEMWVVTHPRDRETIELAESIPNVRVHQTEAFYRNGAAFNKGLAMEEGFEAMGRHGWLVVLDADILLPHTLPLPALNIQKLYSPRRRILKDVAEWEPNLNWSRLPLNRDVEFAGYFHMFYADCVALHGKRPWYGVDWSHAGGCDFYFQNHWASQKKVRMHFDVLHLGPVDTNWCGRVSPRADGQVIVESEQRRESMEQEFPMYLEWRKQQR